MTNTKELNLNFLNIANEDLKLGVHKDGKIYFNKVAIEKMGLTSDCFFKISKFDNEKFIYMVKTIEEKNSIKMHAIPSSGYSYIKYNSIFRKIGFKLNEKYHIEILNHKGQQIYKVHI